MQQRLLRKNLQAQSQSGFFIAMSLNQIYIRWIMCDRAITCLENSPTIIGISGKIAGAPPLQKLT